MSENSLEHRRNWYRFFPEGSIEFLSVTRVLALLLLLSLAIVPNTRRPAVLVALAIVLWIDYLLILWWVVQLATDLNALFAQPLPGAKVLRRRRIGAAILGALPATAALFILAPWPHFLTTSEAARLAMTRVTVPIFCVLFVALAFVAHRALQRIQLGRPQWTLLLLVPIFHWFALHRLLTSLHARVRQRSQASGKLTDDDPGRGPAVIIADVTWVLSVLPWGILVILTLMAGEWPRTMPYSATPGCGTILAAPFAIADLAAMENLQRRFVALIRKP